MGYCTGWYRYVVHMRVESVQAMKPQAIDPCIGGSPDWARSSRRELRRLDLLRLEPATEAAAAAAETETVALLVTQVVDACRRA